MGVTVPGPSGEVKENYEISNSLRFNNDDSPKLTQTVPSTATSTKIMTWNLWFKRCLLADIQLFASSRQDGSNLLDFRFHSDDTIIIQDYTSGSTNMLLTTNAKFRDVSAWYNIHVVIDTTNGTANNRNRLYINGVEETSFASRTNYSLNDDVYRWNTSGVTRGIGYETDTNAEYCDGYFSDYHFIDGTAKSPTDFGEFDDNGVWIPKRYTGAYGNNGFFLEFQQTGTSQNSSGIGADTSGNDNHWAVSNLAATDVTEDTPTNNFATLNPLSADNTTLSEGNVEGIRTTTGATSVVSTIAPTSGKWYVEFKNTAAQNSSIGVVNLDDWASGTDIYDFSEAAAILIESNQNFNVTYGNTASSPTTLQNSTDLVTAKYGLAIDIDNNDLYVSANGNWYGGSSFNQSDFSNATAVTTDLPSNVPLAFFVRGSLANTFYVNFGNAGGDDTISSGNTDGKYGNFEYAVPSGYYALCTKRLAEFG